MQKVESKNIKSSSALEKEFLTALFRKFDSENIDYCILRNDEGLPFVLLGSDLDLVIDVRYQKIGLKLISRIAKRFGWRVINVYKKNYQITHIKLFQAGEQGEPRILRIDLSCDVGLGSVRFLDNKTILKNRHRNPQGLSVLDDWLQDSISVLFSSFNGVPAKKKYVHAFRARSDNTETYEFLVMFLGENLTKVVLNHFLHGSTQSRSTTIEVRFKALASFFKRGFFGAMAAQLLWIWSVAGRVVSPPGEFWVLLGPDGVGKSSVSRHLESSLKAAFPLVHVDHLRPKLLPMLGSVVKAYPLRHEQLPSGGAFRQSAVRLTKSWVRVAYYGSDYFFGYWVKIWPKLVKGELVIYDRYFYDYYVDQHQKGVYLSPSILSGIFRFAPKPNHVVILNASPDCIRARRADLEVDEIVRQNAALLDLQLQHSNFSTVKADERIEVVSDSVINAIHGAFADVDDANVC